VVAKVEFHCGELFPRVGLIVTTPETDSRAVVRIYSKGISPSLQYPQFVRQSVVPGSVVVTDGLQPYRVLPAAGYVHRRKVVRGSGDNPDALLPRGHRVTSLLKRWLLGTHRGRVERAHLPYYLDEFTFRFNRRTFRHRGMLFNRLVQQALAVDPAPYGRLIGGSKHPTPQDMGST
jgi:transposase-like protein